MRVLVLSPHRDDAAFSCGLTMNWLVSRGDALTIVNTCTISSYAPYTSAHGNADLVTRMRKEEDEAFIRRLKAVSYLPEPSVNMIDLGWKDAPLRWGVDDDRVLDPMELPASEVEGLARQFDALQPEIVLAPISLGEHVDHRLVHKAALSSFSPEKLIFYEDLPYACRLTEPERLEAQQRISWMGLPYLLPAKSIATLKREFGLCYPSQVATEVAAEMEAYARTLGGRERFYGRSESLIWMDLLPGDTENRQAAMEELS